jgi:hypothetical protein
MKEKVKLSALLFSENRVMLADSSLSLKSANIDNDSMAISIVNIRIMAFQGKVPTQNFIFITKFY